ncbi:family 31 carbohydrate-binding protein [Flammeovirga sp. MY04]|uniref:di-heme oxidoredictase family protein n=1 Tax=Flammeovirga sp. MY04 TaxID=1191459 RepID=UPI0013050E78|nr:di-heme oxidoredictase family protein [Flammeovirga sp. MY04]ANQ48104.2 family 31 carbohydrate-binding protein [Flammeovirga sp. MY04]
MNELSTMKKGNFFSELYQRLTIDGSKKTFQLMFSALFFMFFNTSMSYAQEYGIEVDNGTATIYFNDQAGWTGGWNYICLGSNCTSGAKVGNRWERQVSGITVGNTYDIQIKIATSTGQYISDLHSVVAVAKGDTPPSAPTCNDGIQNGDETGIDCGGSCTPCQTPPTCDDGIQNGDETGVDCGGSSCQPCQTTPPPTHSNMVEAEGAIIVGSASIYEDGAASNGNGVAYISAQGAGFTINSAPASSTVELVYASELSGEISIFVNGIDQGNMQFSSTGAWVGNYQTVSKALDIQEGDSFSVIFQTGDAALNIDKVNFLGEPAPPQPCTGLNDPNAVFTGVTTINETSDGALDGSVTFIFNNVANDYDSVIFNIDNTDYKVAISEGSLTINNKSAGSYVASMRWSNGDCETSLGTVTVGSCENGIKDGNEADVDCGGVCPTCPEPPQPTPEDLVISVATSPTHGQCLTAKYGNQPALAIYTWDNDTNEFGSCTGGCEDSWPYVVTDAKVNLILPSSLPNGVTGEFGLSGTCDGRLQLTFDGQPLYYYAGDNEGDTNGESAGNVWWLVKEVVTNTCSDGIQNGDETGIDCGGSCTPCQSGGTGEGTCGDFGLTIVDGQGVLYYSEDLGTALYLCMNGGCYPPDAQEDGYYKRYVQVQAGVDYTIKVQGSNEQEKVAQVTQCYFVPTCNDGIQNGDETGVDCGGSSCTACPTCDDGIQNGQETGVDCGGPDCISCEVVCNGTPNPNATVTKQDESFENENDGILTLSFDDVAGRDVLEFSLDGGVTYPYSENDDLKWITITDLAPGNYHVFVRWGNGGDCPIDLGNVAILEGGPLPTCYDGIRNQGETRVDCGGPCAPCEEDPCGDIPLVLYPAPALPTPTVGSPAREHGWSFDLSEDKTQVSVSIGPGVADQMQTNSGTFEMSCSCNQVTFYTAELGDNMQANVPQECVDAGDFYYFFRYKRNTDMNTYDPADIWVYSGLFTTKGERIDPDSRPAIVSKGASWMRFRHPHPQDGITEAIFDASHNGSLLRTLDRYETVVYDAPDNVRFEQFLYSTKDNEIRHEDQKTLPNKDKLIWEGGNRIPVRRMEFLAKGGASTPSYAAYIAPGGPTYDQGGDLYPWSDITTVNYGNIISYEITAVTALVDGVPWSIGAQHYNTFQNYVVGQGFNTFGDPRLSMAGRASSNMILSGSGQFTKEEQDAVFTQHLITLEDDDDVDDFLEGHHLFHGVRHRTQGDGQQDNRVLGEINIGSTSCGSCHFRDGRGSELVNTPKGQLLPPPVYGVGLLQWIAGAEAGLTWDGSQATVESQTVAALLNDHGVDATDPNQISQEDFDQLVAYTKFLTVPTRSKGVYDDPQVVVGHVKFIEAGCVSCHTETQKTRSDAPEMFKDIVIRPYTDMKLHNIGTGGSYRTPPLWGLYYNMQVLERNGKALLFMHNASASTVGEAIMKHGGEAAGSRAAYEALTLEEQEAVIKFVESL